MKEVQRGAIFVKKRVLAGILAVLLSASVVFDPIQQMVVQASEMNQIETVTNESIVETETEEAVDTTERTEETEIIDVSTETEKEVTEETEVEETEEVSATESEEETEAVEKRYYIQYLMMDSDKVSLNETQKVVIGLDCEKEISDAVLKYHNVENGTEYTQTFTDNEDGALLFEMLFQKEEQKGQYQLDELTYKVGENTYTEAFKEAGIDVSFGVETDVETNPDAYVENDSEENADVDIDVVRIDEEGNAISEDDISDAIQNVTEDNIATYSVQTADTRSKKDIVVVLDPGHDDTHKGASANGLREEEINLKIASYCKAELENYSGIKVYMTRTSGSCTHPGTTSGVDNEERVKYAASVGADIYVSIHNNSSTSSSAHGAMVFYPNSNYNPSVGYTGKQLAQVIEKHLVALGLANRGITIRDAKVDKYPDGSKADYYGVIRNAKLAGIPAIIVEHAFLTNTGDANDFLKQEGKLKQMGIADAQAIVEYYNLGKTVNITSDGVKVANVNNDAGTALLSAWNVQPVDKVKKVSFAVWSKSDASDLKWYDINNTGSTTYAAEMNIKNHNYNTGTYSVDAYAYDIYGDSHYLGGNKVSFTQNVTKATVTAVGNDTESQYTITASGMSVTGGVKQVRIAVWNKEKGQSNLVWYTAQNDGTGKWKVDVPIKNHKAAGMYSADVYVYNNAGQPIYAGGTSFEVSDISGGEVSVENQDVNTGKFDILITGIKAKAGIEQVRVPIWSKSDGSDIFWYTATKLSDENYIIHADIANHNYNYGDYSIDVYATTKTGIQKYLGGKKTTVSLPKVAIDITGNSTESQYIISAKNVVVPGGVKEVRAAVWSNANNGKDLKWYTAINSATGVWDASVPIINHKASGKYNVDMYAINNAGQSVYLGGSTFNVSEMSVGKIVVSNIDEKQGTFDVVIHDVVSKSGVKQIRVPVWSKSDGSDIYWYLASKNSDGTYVAHVNIANHDYNYGKYSIDVYGITSTEIKKYLGGTTGQINVPKTAVTVVTDEKETKYTLKLDNVNIVGGIKEIKAAIWSNTNKQKDLAWYEVQKQSDSSWSMNIPISDYKVSGTYYVDVYAVNSKGKSVYIGGTKFDVSGITAKSVEVENKQENGNFDVVIKDVVSKSGIDNIRVAVWSNSDASDLYWYTAIKNQENNYVANVDIANHNYNFGKFYIDVYGKATNGVNQYLGGGTTEIVQPKSAIIAKANENQTEYSIVAANIRVAGGARSVRMAVWSKQNEQADLRWYDASKIGNDSWKTTVDIAQYGVSGTYYVDAYATGSDGNKVYLGGTKFEVDAPSVDKVEVTNLNESRGTFEVKASGIHSKAGVNTVKIAVWCAKNQSDLKWYDAVVSKDGSYTISVDIRNHNGNTGNYYADAYLTDNNGVKVYAGGCSCSVIYVSSLYHSIAGVSGTTVDQMVSYYKAHAVYPSYYANTEAPTIEAFCRIYMEECKMEGIKSEVAFCQAMKETGFLKYGGNVKIEQYNFAGLGSTGAGVPGESYPNVRTGIRAQVQHLKAYANSDSLNNACVDNRFKYVTRNSAPYVEWLGIQENPYHKGWASAQNYGYQIVTMMNEMQKY